jgi:hypothetical protein
METEGIEQVADVSSPKSVSGSKVKNTKKILAGAKMCVYFKDMECRIPVCDMKACEKCSEGHIFCTRVNFIKSMLKRILLFIIGVVFFFEC